MKHFIYLPIIAVLLLSCQENIVSECDPVQDDPLPKTTFATLQNEIFNVHCTSCHGGPTPTAGFDLSPEVAYSNLINQPSNSSTFIRVVPFDAERSYLYRVLDGTNAPLMPPGNRLPRATIDSVAAWINRGAPES